MMYCRPASSCLANAAILVMLPRSGRTSPIRHGSSAFKRHRHWGRSASKKMKGRLIALLSDEHWWVCYRAAEALSNLPWMTIERLTQLCEALTTVEAKEHLLPFMAQSHVKTDQPNAAILHRCARPGKPPRHVAWETDHPFERSLGCDDRPVTRDGLRESWHAASIGRWVPCNSGTVTIVPCCSIPCTEEPERASSHPFGTSRVNRRWDLAPSASPAVPSTRAPIH